MAKLESISHIYDDIKQLRKLHENISNSRFQSQLGKKSFSFCPHFPVLLFFYYGRRRSRTTDQNEYKLVSHRGGKSWKSSRTNDSDRHSSRIYHHLEVGVNRAKVQIDLSSYSGKEKED